MLELKPLLKSGHQDGEEYEEHEDRNDENILNSFVRENDGLKRQVGLVGGLSLLIGTIIGSGIFASPSSVATYSKDTGTFLLIWTACGILAMFSALCWCELGTLFPNASGGEHQYLLQGFGPLPAFLFSYVNVLITRPASLAAIAITCGDYIITAVSQCNSSQRESKMIAALLLEDGLETNQISGSQNSKPEVYNVQNNIENNNSSVSCETKDGSCEDGKQGLKIKKTVGLMGGISLIVGVMIGSGIFASTAAVFNNANNVWTSLIIWALCGVLVMLASLCWVELGLMIPRSGGEFYYLWEAFGEIAAFIFTFSSVVLLRPAGLAAILVATGDYIVEPFFGTECDVFIAEKAFIAKIIAALLLGIIVFVNCASVRWATSMQVFFTAAKLLAIAMLIITGLVRLGQGHTDSFKNSFEGTSSSISEIGYAFYGGLWAYDGWNNLNYVTEELKNPIRDLPLAIMIGIPLVTGCYVLVNIAYLTVLTSVEIAGSNAVAVTLANQLYGVMAWVIPVFVACSTFGAANGSAFTSGRLVYVSAREGHMPKLLAMVHTKRHTPLPALIFTCVIAWIMLIPESSNFATLVNYFNFAAWTFYGATVAALLWLRYKKPDLKRPYKVFIGIPIIVLLCAIYLVLAPFYDFPLQSFYCLLFILCGIPVYFMFVKYKILPKAFTDGFDKMTYKIQMLADLSMPETREDTQEM